jgi:hypothetical protein
LSTLPSTLRLIRKTHLLPRTFLPGGRVTSILFIKNVRHLILEVLCSHCVVRHELNKHETWVKLNGRRTKRIQKLLPGFVFEGDKSPKAPLTFEWMSNAFHR